MSTSGGGGDAVVLRTAENRKLPSPASMHPLWFTPVQLLSGTALGGSRVQVFFIITVLLPAQKDSYSSPQAAVLVIRQVLVIKNFPSKHSCEGQCLKHSPFS